MSTENYSFVGEQITIMKLNNLKIEIKWALIFIATTLIWMVIEKVFGFHDTRIEQHVIITNVFVVPAILIYILALMDKRRIYFNGIMTYKQGVISGIIITAIITLFIPITQSIISLVITPDYFENMSAYSVEKGLMTQESAEENFSLRSYIIQGMIATPIIGTVTTLIVAFFTRKS